MNLIERLFHPGQRLGSKPGSTDLTNTETYSEPFDAFPETDWKADPAAEAIREACMIRFCFIQGQPGSRGFLVNGSPACEVFLAGNFNEWDPASLPLEQYADGYWEADVPLHPGRHEYVFVIDGIWCPDPLAESLPNPFGGVNSVVTVPP